MKSLLYFILLFLILTSCTVSKPPVFIKVDNVKIVSFTSDTIRLKVDAFFENPNDVGGKISTDKIMIIVNDNEVAQITSEEFKVPAQKEFTMPLFASIPTKNLLETNQNGVLGSLINSFLTKKIHVRIKGNLQYVVFGFKKEFKLDKTEEIKIKF
jgi:hypothetical protein